MEALIALQGGDGDDELSGGADADTLEGGAGDDKLWGEVGDDRISGGDGTDFLSGEDGNDSLFGGAGDDFLLGGGGNDSIDGGDGVDHITVMREDLAPGTSKLISGGKNPVGAVDTVFLPGAATDYHWNVRFGATWESTNTVLSSLRQPPPRGPTIELNNVEKLVFGATSENKVTISKPAGVVKNSLAIEMAVLSKEVYGPLETLSHTAEMLASDRIGFLVTSDPVTDAAVKRGWHAVSAMELGIKPGDFNDPAELARYGGLNWSFAQGHYAAIKPAHVGPVSALKSDRPEANASVLTGVLPDGKKALAVVFRGTDQWADFDTYLNFAQHYAYFKPLIDGLRTYLSENAIDTVLVSGHSLGASVAAHFLKESFISARADVRSFSFGSPGSEVAPTNKTLNFIHTDDLVTLAAPGSQLLALAGLNPPSALSLLLKTVGFSARDRTGPEIRINSDVSSSTGTDEHAQTLYVKTVTKLVKFAQDPDSPFATTELARALLSGATYTGPNLQIGVGRPYSELGDDYGGPYVFRVFASRFDNFVLAGDLTETIWVSASELMAAGTRVFDGGDGGTDSLFLDDHWMSFAMIRNANGSVSVRYALGDGPGTAAVGIAHRIERLQFSDRVTDQYGADLAAERPATSGHLDGEIDAVAVPEFRLTGTFEWADAGDGAMSVIGTASGDTIYLGRGAKTVTGLAGDDMIVVKPGAAGEAAGDTITLDGGAGADFMVGWNGADTFIVDEAGDQVIAKGGIDTIRSSVSYALGADAETLVLLAGAANGAGNDAANLVVGNLAANRLSGRDGDDTLEGGDGDDTLSGGSDADLLDGGAGDDMLHPESGTDTITGGAGMDLLTGDAAAVDGDRFLDFGLNDAVIVDSLDLVAGRAPTIAVTADGAGSRVGVDVDADGTEDFFFTSGIDLSGLGLAIVRLDGAIGIGCITLNGTAGADDLSGNPLDNFLNGLEGNDTIRGGLGTDWITPGAGNDAVFGGAGSDMVSFVDATTAVIVDLAAGTAQGGSGADSLDGIENVTGSVHGDFIATDGAANRIRALGGYDWIVGSGGTDNLDGGTGRDMVSYVNATSGVSANLATGLGTVGQATGDRYTSIERLTGSIHNDFFVGDAGENDFRGLGGYDWFVGSAGRDRYDGGSGFDVVSYANSTAGVTASLLLGRGTGGDANRDLYTSIENLTGTSFADILTGDNGRNTLRGLYGADTIYGNGGVDRITGGGSDDDIDGGSGFDYAYFSASRAEYQIETFAHGRTTVDFRGAGGDGTDTLLNIEALVFTDTMVFL